MQSFHAMPSLAEKMMSNIFTCKTFQTQQQTLIFPDRPEVLRHRSREDCSLHPFRQRGISGLVVRSSVSEREALQSRSSVVSDQTVPEGHRGLHSFLYGERDADVHSSDSAPAHSSVADNGVSVESLDDYLNARDGMKFAGIFSLYDNQNVLQYVGFSRNVIVSLRSYLQKIGGGKCASVRVKTFSDPAMITRTRLDEERQKWLSECATPPPGNSVEKDLWEGSPGTTAMSDAEKAEYEAKKLKMRKAMGENLHDDLEGEEDDARTRRLKLLQAVEGDDWSDVIDGQTKETANGRALNGVESSSRMVSPFERRERGESSAAAGLYSADTFELSLQNVDMVLNDVRPYLIADGGNVEVVSVDKGIVSLRLQGACGTCPSSTVTMKMGIERVLKEKFADAVKEVVQVDQQQIGASIQSVNAHLDILRPAIHNYGGAVDVVSVENGECKVKFKGPPPIGMGIQAAIKDKFPEISTVILVDA